MPEIDIKCSECGKGTRNFELGAIYYIPDNPSETIIVENQIICPKCGKDISNRRCMIKHKDLLLKMFTANICLISKDIPEHLRGILPLDDDSYEIMKQRARSKPKLVEKF